MAPATPARTSFLGGEWSARAQGRFDRPDYQTSLNVCLNGIALEAGAWTRRPGTMFAGLTRGGRPGRVVKWDFEQIDPVTLELTAGFLRFRVGAALATTNDDQVVTSISQANPPVVNTASAHGWASGNSVQFPNLANALPLLQNRIFGITVLSSTTFSIFDGVTGAPINGSTLGVVPQGITAQRIAELSTPYNGQLWEDVRLVQAELQGVLLHPTIPPQILTATLPTGTQTYPTFTLAPGNLIDGPYLDQPTNGATLTPSGTTGIITLTIEFASYVSTTAYQKGDLVNSSSVNYQSLIDQNAGNTPASSPSAWAPVSAGIAIGPNGFVGSDVGRLIRLLRSGDTYWAWGKIVALANQISGGTGTNIGNMTGGGGLAAAFDGVTNQLAAASASLESDNVITANCFVGKNYTGGANQIHHATVWGSQDAAFATATETYTTTNYQASFAPGAPGLWVSTTVYNHGAVVTGSDGFEYTSALFGGNIGHDPTTTPSLWVKGGEVGRVWLQSASQQIKVPVPIASVQVNLRAKQTAPASSSDGTLLGSTLWGGQSPVSVVASDQATSWNYVWIEMATAMTSPAIPPDTIVPNPPSLAQVLAGAGGSFSVLNSTALVQVTAEVQFFLPPGAGTGNAVTFQLLGTFGLDATTPRPFRLGAYSNTTAWPSCGTYHEGRLWLSGAISNRTDSTTTIDLVTEPFNMAPTDPIASPGGTVLDSSAITAVFNASDVNAIYWMESDQLGIILGTQAGNWLVQASALNNPLTPTSIQAHRYDRLGSANIEPARAGGPLVMVHRHKRKLLELFADVFSGRLVAQHLTWKNQHHTAPGIAEVKYQNELAPIVWARCDDGSLFGATYKREKLMSGQEADFFAPFRVSLGGGRTVESITVGPSPDGQLDSLTMVTFDAASGLRHVEILTDLFAEGAAVAGAWFLDDAVRPTTFVGNPYLMTGLWHLNGRTVTVFAGGLDCGDWPVSNGQIGMTYGDGISQGTGGGMFTAAFALQDIEVVVGFTYNSDGQLTRPMSPQESGARTGPALGIRRRLHRLAMLLEGTVGGLAPETGTSTVPAAAVGLQVGTDFAHLRPAVFRSGDDGTALPYGTAFTGVWWDMLDDASTYDGMVCWRIARPWPATIAAIEPSLETQG